MSSEWRRLRLSQESLPPLLCQYTWTRQGYELYVTDLTSIWSERLSRKEILKRADDCATTIDPSEDLDQLDLLLTKIGEALRGDGGTTTTINTSTTSDSLELNTSTKLPAPLRPLKWTLYLSKEPASSTTSHLVLPLLRGEASWESRQRSLLDQLKQKDWVLGKLFDRFEALGADLGTVFPGAAGLRTTRKGSSRPEAAKFIKGVAPFNEQSWLAESVGSSSSSKVAFNLVHELAGSGTSLDIERLRPSQDKWWSSLQRHPETLSFQEEETKKPSTSQSRAKPIESQGDVDLDEETASESDLDEFEQQEVVPRHRAQDTKPAISPPKPKAKKKSLSPSPQTAHTNDGTATESEHELEPELLPPPRRRRTPTPTASPPPKPTVPDTPPKEPIKKPKKGLGVIGGKKKIPEPEPQPERVPSPPPKEPSMQPEDHAPAIASPPKTKKPTRLGMIGGKTKTKAAPPTETHPAQQESPALVPSPERKPRGQSPAPMQPVTDSVSPEMESREPSLPVKAPSAAPAPEETEAQRADRKREELKRQLEAKSKVPAKKKRRF
ncbi:uncharacterized protein N7496_000996 [Penicillium cataractarum]|uniref:Non-homologous end-joining factor 1 n=1 Tax=Penicillium cataractarum TaxID=2100454 RepID=A0A9X0B6H7_9EURO|nr:uncharacterized protein N7496_000996 [Penicillium cataractarum]KAJ5389928.1 hypothetical protein N7496_000996 [Penicillium cataractarum]